MVPLRFGTNNLYFVTRIKKIEFLSPKKKKKIQLGQKCENFNSGTKWACMVLKKQELKPNRNRTEFCETASVVHSLFYYQLADS